MNHKTGKLAQQIIEMQNQDGTWGNEFHSLAIPNNKKPLTTEQALRRLYYLGFTINDEPVRKTVDCMVSCLKGERKIDNYWEKTRDWNEFTKLMLSTWVRIFEPNNETALVYARHLAQKLDEQFSNGTYDADTEEVDFVTFYEMNLLQGLLSEETERRMLDYVINHQKGIYYIYGSPICILPQEFQSIETSRYLAAIDILAGYKTAKEKLGFVVEWLEENKDENGQWDLGANAKDNLYFPLSDSWRSAEHRKADCTEKILSIIEKLK